MGLETGITISQLVSSNPTGGDPTNQGDDHLQLIKAVLKAQFPGVGGQGYAEAIIANEDELNFSVGVTSLIQAQFDAIDVQLDAINTTLPAPVGTRMVFNQAAAPTGWTQDASISGHMMRVVPGVGGGTGGSDDPISFAHTHTTADHQLTEAEMPSHTHTAGAAGSSSSDNGSNVATVTTGSTTATGGDQVHNHGITGSVSYSPLFIDTIIGVKD